MKKRTLFVLILLCVSIAIGAVYMYEPYAMLNNRWKNKLTAPISTAFNVYCKKGESCDVSYIEEETYLAVYVTPSENTFIQLDYAGDEPLVLDELYDEELVESGYRRVAGMNAGFFNSFGNEYGRPTGAVLVDGEWAEWSGIELTPGYGNGNVTVYFNGDDETFEMKYHGWQNGIWMPLSDTFFDYEESCYQITTKFGVSGAYSLLNHGVRTWWGKTDSRYWNKSRNSIVSLFGVTEDGRYLLVVSRGCDDGEDETSLMQSLGAYSALRMDGSTSSSVMVLKKYEQ